jgi:hypothetical protein
LRTMTGPEGLHAAPRKCDRATGARYKRAESWR